MTTQFDFTNNEWDAIAIVPTLVGFAVAKAEDSGRFGSMLEIRTLVSSLEARVKNNRAKSLIHGAAGINIKSKLDEFESIAPDILGDVAVRVCGEVAKILEAKAEPGEAQDYMDWVLGVANDVANAAKEDGVRVSAPEAALLDRLKAALAA